MLRKCIPRASIPRQRGDDRAAEGNEGYMLTKIASAACARNGCPAVYAHADGEAAVVQGYAVHPEDHGLDVPTGELLVSVPTSLLLDAASTLTRG
jgi:hypothetical protein